jgi:hypothetical protein
LASAALLRFVLVIALAAAGAILRNGRARRNSEQECDKQTANIDHDRFLKFRAAASFELDGAVDLD